MVKSLIQDNLFDFSFTLNGRYHQLVQKRPKDLNEKNISISWSKVRHVRFEKPSPGQNVIMLRKYVLNKRFCVSVIGIVPRNRKTGKTGDTELNVPLNLDIHAYFESNGDLKVMEF